MRASPALVSCFVFAYAVADSHEPLLDSGDQRRFIKDGVRARVVVNR